jgi:hypothetical protein
MVFAQTRASPNAALGWEGEQKQIKPYYVYISK